MKIGAPISEVSNRRMPDSVPPRDRTMMDMMKVTKNTGPATSHDAKPKNGTSAAPQIRKIRIHAAFASPL